jgi:hypothetical protein
MTNDLMRHRLVLGLLRVTVIMALAGEAASAQAPTPSGGWLGVALSCDGCDGERSGGQRATGPLIVRRIAPGSPAERILAAGDTIVRVNGDISDPRRMREVLLATPANAPLEFVLHGARGRYTVKLRKQPDRLVGVGRDSLPLKYQAVFAGVGVDVLTPGAPVVSRDATGALIIRLGEHAVRLRLPSDTALRVAER